MNIGSNQQQLIDFPLEDKKEKKENKIDAQQQYIYTIYGISEMNGNYCYIVLFVNQYIKSILTSLWFSYFLNNKSYSSYYD